MKLWIPDLEDRQVSRVALRGFTDNQSNEALVKLWLKGKLHALRVGTTGRVGGKKPLQFAMAPSSGGVAEKHQ